MKEKAFFFFFIKGFQLPEIGLENEVRFNSECFIMLQETKLTRKAL